MRGIFKIPCFLIAALCVTGLLCSPSFAGRNIVNKEKKLEDIDKKLREAKKSIKESNKKEEDILGALDTYDKELAELRAKLTALNESIMNVQGELKQANVNLSKLTRERVELKDRLGKRLRAIYKMRNGWIMRVVFTDAPSVEVSRRYKLMSLVLESDRRLIRRAEENFRDWEAEKKRFSALERTLTEAKKEALANKGDIEKKSKERKTLLAGVRKKKDSYLRLEKDLENAKAELKALINSLRAGDGFVDDDTEDYSSGFASMRGRLKMPVDGRIVSSYGKVKHPKFNTVTFNNGIVIEAPYGHDVRSVYGGKVAYVGWLKGYGQVMIVDNGGGYYTLYAYLSEALKKTGETVVSGERIALVGDSGSSGMMGLYFEVRQKGVPKDPSAWLALND